MKRWKPGAPPAPLPPPSHGIRVQKPGATWWGKRWIAALERLSAGYSSRLSRGRTYARQGRVHDLVVKPGEVTALVTGSRRTPYEVRIGLPRLKDVTWQKAIRAMARKAQFSAELLAGVMPKDIENAFREAGSSLFPVRSGDLRTHCTCPDWATPCKHVAATHYVLAEAFDADPFLLFELRGRTRAQVLEGLRNARSGGARERPRRRRRRSAREPQSTAGVSLSGVTPEEYEKPRAPLPVVHLSLDAPTGSEGLLAQLGAPAGWIGDQSPADLLAPLVRGAAARALAIALAEARERAPQPAPEHAEPEALPAPRRGRRPRRS
jgi:uncharacterized Zn finger protein